MTANPPIQITLTKEQLEDFLDIVCLGEWMINAVRVDPIQKYDDLAQIVYKAAAEAGLKGVERDKPVGEYLPTAEYEDGVLQEFKEDYDDETFWNGLADRLAERDMERKYGSKGIAAMGQKEYFRAHQTICQQYEEEFEEHGLERLTAPGLPEEDPT